MIALGNERLKGGVMRRILVVMLVCVGVVLGVAALASAQTDPYPPTADQTGVAGISTARTAGSSGSSTQLPFTGSDGTNTLVLAGGGLALAGGAIVFISYRRRASLDV